MATVCAFTTLLLTSPQVYNITSIETYTHCNHSSHSCFLSLFSSFHALPNQMCNRHPFSPRPPVCGVLCHIVLGMRGKCTALAYKGNVTLARPLATWDQAREVILGVCARACVRVPACVSVCMCILHAALPGAGIMALPSGWALSLQWICHCCCYYLLWHYVLALRWAVSACVHAQVCECVRAC